MSNKRVIILKDIVSEVVSSINELTKQQVLIGFPESTDVRQGDDGQPMTNAALGYIHEFGSPRENIPARPFLIPGVEDTTPQTTERLRDAADYALSGKKAMGQRRLEEAGMIAAGGAKRAITAGAGFAPLKPSTILHRAASRDTKTMRPEEKKYFELLDSGMSEAAAQSAAGIKPLINTGELRNAITSVVRKKA